MALGPRPRVAQSADDVGGAAIGGIGGALLFTALALRDDTIAIEWEPAQGAPRLEPVKYGVLL